MKNSDYQEHPLRKKKCVLCDSSNISALIERGERAVVKCRDCALIYQFPQVSKDRYLNEIQKHYSDVDPSFRVAYSRKRLYKKFLYRIEHLKRKNARLLDVGCGWGYFLSLAKDDGWKAYGLELNLDLVEKGLQDYGLNILCADFEESNFRNGYFDVITLWSVFDELYDPLNGILKIKKFLKPGGILYLRTLNGAFHLFIYRIQQVLRKLHLAHLMPYQSSIFHIFNFSNRTLKQILSNNGFKNIKIKNSWPTSGDPYGVKKGVRGFKIFIYLIAQCLSFLTCGKLTAAPSIEAFAENAKN